MKASASSNSMQVNCQSHIPMEAVHHLEVAPQVLFGEVVKHARVHQTLHEVGAVLRKTKAGQPFIPYPLMIHVSVSKSLQGQE